MGKHPVAPDYFQLGPRAPLVKAFSGWIENGYRKLISVNQVGAEFHSWRFWAKGDRKGYIACGIGRDSVDSLGRPYPLLVMGIGKLPGWEDHWDLLPFVLENMWTQTEYLSSRPFRDLKQLEDEIRCIKLPFADWSALIERGLIDKVLDETAETNRSPRLTDDIEKAAQALLLQDEFYVSIKSNDSGGAFSLAKRWNCVLKPRIKIVPNAVFMGGIPEKSYLAIFNRALNSSDFVRLWSVFSH